MEAKIVVGGREFVAEIRDTDGFFEDDVLEGSRVGKYQVDLAATGAVKKMEE